MSTALGMGYTPLLGTDLEEGAACCTATPATAMRRTLASLIMLGSTALVVQPRATAVTPALRPRAPAVLMEKQPDVYEEASRQQFANFPAIFGVLVLYVGVPAVLGPDNTAAAGAWLHASPLGGLWDALSQPLFSRQEVTDAADTAYQTCALLCSFSAIAGSPLHLVCSCLGVWCRRAAWAC